VRTGKGSVPSRIRPDSLCLVCVGESIQHSSDVGGSQLMKGSVVDQSRNTASSHVTFGEGKCEDTGRTLRAVTLIQQALALLTEQAKEASRPSEPHAQHDRLIRLPEVQTLTGLRRSAIYEQMQRGTFPRSVKVGPRAAVWSESSIQAWIAECLRGRSGNRM
jgi:predicted DNA-binding transcriptional regulator AlpA